MADSFHDMVIKLARRTMDLNAEFERMPTYDGEIWEEDVKLLYQIIDRIEYILEDYPRPAEPETPDEIETRWERLQRMYLNK